MTIQLIVHIGTGKTGSTAIQRHLSKHRDELCRQGYAYWGLNLEYAPTKTRREWQRQGGTGTLQRMGIENAIRELSQALNEAILQADAESTIIWSNESIYERPSVYIPVIEALQKEHNLSCRIVAYTRNLPSYILSAYKQWGIKHKTYAGTVQSFKTWVNNHKRFLSYPSVLQTWEDSLSPSLDIYNYDILDNVVSHFCRSYSIPSAAPSSDSQDRSNSTPSDMLLAMYALHNSRFPAPVLPERITKLIKDYGLENDNFDTPNLTTLYVDKQELEQFKDFIEQQHNVVNDLLKYHGQPQLEPNVSAESLRRPSESQILSGLISILLALALQQDDRIKALERQVTKK